MTTNLARVLAELPDHGEHVTVICAYDHPEAVAVRRAIGLAPRQVIEATSPERLAGTCAWELRILETRRFGSRPDAEAIRQTLVGVSCSSHTVRTIRVAPGDY
ncbi:hypothetical protein ACWCSD_34465 [Nonomuraea sp. NPDC001684]